MATNAIERKYAELTPHFDKWEKSFGDAPPEVEGVPITRHWLIPPAQRPKYYMSHPAMTPDEIRALTQRVWDRFYSIPQIWARSRCVKSLKARLAIRDALQRRLVQAL